MKSEKGITIRMCLTVVVMVASQTLGAHAAQSHPDFSGRWVLIDSGVGQGQTGGSGSPRNPQVVISGAGFNCASGCTIVQTASTLTVSRPANAKGVTPPDVVLGLEGQVGSVKATATWDGLKLVVTRTVALSTIRQTISLDEGRLRLVTTFDTPGIDPVTFIYKKAG
jgi:hypothetical protein